jgi:hypothetical protein
MTMGNCDSSGRVSENHGSGSRHRCKFTYHVDKKPVFGIDGVCIEEESSASKALVKEVGSEVCEPVESVEASAGFKHEEGSYLLDEQTDDDGPPLDSRPVL